jgi:hypothetical protein
MEPGFCLFIIVIGIALIWQWISKMVSPPSSGEPPQTETYYPPEDTSWVEDFVWFDMISDDDW